MQNTSHLVSKRFNRFHWNLKPRFLVWWGIIWINISILRNRTRHLQTLNNVRQKQLPWVTHIVWYWCRAYCFLRYKQAGDTSTVQPYEAVSIEPLVENMAAPSDSRSLATDEAEKRPVPLTLFKIVHKIVHIYLFSIWPIVSWIFSCKKGTALYDHSLPVADDWLRIGIQCVNSRNCWSSLIWVLHYPQAWYPTSPMHPPIYKDTTSWEWGSNEDHLRESLYCKYGSLKILSFYFWLPYGPLWPTCILTFDILYYNSKTKCIMSNYVFFLISFVKMKTLVLVFN